MQQQHELNGDIEQFLQSLQGKESAEDEADNPQEEPPQPTTEEGADEEVQETIHVYFVREPATPQKDVQVIESTPPRSQQNKSDLPAYTTILFFLFLPLFCLGFQFYLVFNPPIVTVTLVPRSQVITLSGTLQLGRKVTPITLSQSQTVPTTGKGHQDPRAATGSLTLFNGQLSIVTVPAGTMITSASGIAIVTDQDAAIPPGNPPTYGQTTVAAQAITPGERGNIAPGDINQACCANAVLAKNTTSFYGGQDKRDFQTVAKQDISPVATTLKTTVTQSMQAALLGQLQPTEQLHLLPCTPAVTSDHQPGQEATQVKVAVSITCSAVAFNTQTVAEKATALLSHQAVQTVGTGYSLLGDVHVSITQATVTHAPTPLVFVSFQARGTWVYAVGTREQQQIKSRIAGKTRQEALQLFASLPGIEHASIRWQGFGDDTKLPKNAGYIHIQVVVV